MVIGLSVKNVVVINLNIIIIIFQGFLRHIKKELKTIRKIIMKNLTNTTKKDILGTLTYMLGEVC
jgi:hypothetical protein